MFSRATTTALFLLTASKASGYVCPPLDPPVAVEGWTNITCTYNQVCPYHKATSTLRPWPCANNATFQGLCPDNIMKFRCGQDAFASADEGDLEDVDVGESGASAVAMISSSLVLLGTAAALF